MHPTLARRLIEKGILRQGSTLSVEAPFYTGLDGMPKPEMRALTLDRAACRADGTIILTLLDAQGDRYRLPAETVREIDGMPVKRLAVIHYLTEAGEDIPQGKRRGRRPKRLLEQMAAEAARVAQ